jgi:hypothetical protein
MAGSPFLYQAFGYFSGIMYALLLNETGVTWKNAVYYSSDLGQTLKEAMGITKLVAVSEIDLTQYKYPHISYPCESSNGIGDGNEYFLMASVLADNSKNCLPEQAGQGGN